MVHVLQLASFELLNVNVGIELGLGLLGLGDMIVNLFARGGDQDGRDVAVVRLVLGAVVSDQAGHHAGAHVEVTVVDGRGLGVEGVGEGRGGGEATDGELVDLGIEGRDLGLLGSGG